MNDVNEESLKNKYQANTIMKLSIVKYGVRVDNFSFAQRYFPILVFTVNNIAFRVKAQIINGL